MTDTTVLTELDERIESYKYALGCMEGLKRAMTKGELWTNERIGQHDKQVARMIIMLYKTLRQKKSLEYPK